MTTIPGDDAKSAAPVSVVASQSQQQENSSASTLTASTGDGFTPSGNFLQDVTARQTLPQRSLNSGTKLLKL